jgi:(2Fe-2S) ferredoxin
MTFASSMEQIPYKTKIHLLVCVNDRSCKEGNIMPSCGPTVTAADVTEVKLWIRQQGWTGSVVATKCQCLGFCNPEGGVACVYPSGRFFKAISSVEDLKNILRDEMDQL